MDSLSWPESLPSNRIKAIQKLTSGQVLTDKLRDLLHRPEKFESDLDSVNGVVTQIVGLFSDTLSILSSSNVVGIPQSQNNDTESPSVWEDQKSEDSDESVQMELPVKRKRGCYKRRKNASVTTSFESSLTDDGYGWRKYGQKTILNSKHQRSYYRCTHKFDQGCQATKQVQMTDDEASKYKITYYGHHTCCKFQIAPQLIVEALSPVDDSMLLNFETNTITKGNKVGSCFPSVERITPDGCPSLGHIKDEQILSFDHHTIWDPIESLASQVPSGSMLSGLDFEDIVSSGVFSSTCSTHGYEIDGVMNGSLDFDYLFK